MRIANVSRKRGGVYSDNIESQYQFDGPQLGGTGVRLTLEVADADAVVARACAAGASVLLPVTQMFWGARYAKLVDPFGHEWGINEQREELSAEAEQANARRYFGGSDQR